MSLLTLWGEQASQSLLIWQGTHVPLVQREVMPGTMALTFDQ